MTEAGPYSLIPLALSFLFALLVSWGVVLPFFQKGGERRGISAEDQSLADMRQRKERLMQALEELEQEHLGGRLSDEEYQLTRAELTQEAAQCLAQLDQSQLDEPASKESDPTNLSQSSES